MRTLDSADMQTHVFVEAVRHTSGDHGSATESAIADRMGMPRGNLKEWIDAGVADGSLTRTDAAGQPAVRFTSEGIARWCLPPYV